MNNINYLENVNIALQIFVKLANQPPANNNIINTLPSF